MANNNETFVENSDGANSTFVENKPIRSSNSTYIEPRRSSNDQTALKTSAPKTIKLGEKEYTLLKRLEVNSGEADIYLIADSSDQKKILKYYRPNVEPKEDVIEILRSLPETSVIKLIEFGKTEAKRCYELQEYAEFGSMQEYIKKNRAASQEFVLAFIKELNKCLKEIHSKNIIHRDIKPANILIKSLDPLDLVLTDFGISSISDLSLHQTSLSRTILYSSPESMSGVISKATDYWALGLIALELLIDRHPFTGIDDKVIMFTLTTKHVPCIDDVPPKYTNLIRGLLTRDPKKRWQHKEIDAWLSGQKNIPIYFEESIDEVRSNTNFNNASVNVAPITRKYRPYRFNEQNFYTLEELSIPMAQEWPKAVKDFESNRLRDWLVREVRDKDSLVLYEDLISDSKLTIDEKIFEFFCRINPDFPLIYKGLLITTQNVASAALKKLKRQTEPVDEEVIITVIKNKIIDRYFEITGKLNEFEQIRIEASCFKKYEEYAKIILIYLYPKFINILIEKIKSIFENGIILRPYPGYSTVEKVVEKAKAIYVHNKYSTKELVIFSTISKDNYVNNEDINKIYLDLKDKCIEINNNEEFKYAMTLTNKIDWDLVQSLAIGDRIEFTKENYERMLFLGQSIISGVVNYKNALDLGVNLEISEYVISISQRKVYDSNQNIILASQKSMFSLSSDMEIADSKGNMLFSIIKKQVNHNSFFSALKSDVLSESHFDIVSSKINQKIGEFFTSGQEIEILGPNNSKICVSNLNNGNSFTRSTVGERVDIIDEFNTHICTVEIGVRNDKAYFTNEARAETRLLILLLFLYFQK